MVRDTTRLLIYVAGPFADKHHVRQTRNVARATFVSWLLTAAGHTPLAPHPAIAAGCYGDDLIPSEREAGCTATLDLLRTICAFGPDHAAVVAILPSFDQGVSLGTKAELAEAAKSECPVLAAPWHALRPALSARLGCEVPDPQTWMELAPSRDHAYGYVGGYAGGGL